MTTSHPITEKPDPVRELAVLFGKHFAGNNVDRTVAFFSDPKNGRQTQKQWAVQLLESLTRMERLYDSAATHQSALRDEFRAAGDRRAAPMETLAQVHTERLADIRGDMQKLHALGRRLDLKLEQVVIPARGAGAPAKARFS